MKTIWIILMGVMLANNVQARSCSVVRKLSNKISKDIEKRNSLEEAIFLNEKIKEVNSWGEYSNIKKSRISMDEVDSVFTIRQTDILLLMDLLVDQEDQHHDDLGVNTGILAGSLAFSFIGSRIISKLLDRGYEAGFMKKVQNLIISDGNNKGKAKKLKLLANAIMLAAPAYIAYEEYKIYQLLKDVKRKMAILATPREKLPELQILEDKIESNQKRLQMEESRLKETCD